MNRQDVIRTIGEALADGGLSGRGRHFRLVQPDLVWMVDLDQIPGTARLGISVGVCPAQLAGEQWPDRANDCPIILYPDAGGEPFGLDHWRSWEGLDAASEIADDERRRSLSEIGDSVAELAGRVTTLNQLKQLYEAGRLRGFVRKDARLLLEGGSTPTGLAR